MPGMICNMISKSSHLSLKPHSIVRGDNMNACELTAAITAIANYLACQLNQDQLELLGVTLTQLGDTLLTIVTQKSICCK